MKTLETKQLEILIAGGYHCDFSSGNIACFSDSSWDPIRDSAYDWYMTLSNMINFLYPDYGGGGGASEEAF